VGFFICGNWKYISHFTEWWGFALRIIKQLEIYFQKWTPCFKWTSIIEKKFLENFMEMSYLCKNEIRWIIQ